jgi:hypothetical protein
VSIAAPTNAATALRRGRTTSEPIAPRLPGRRRYPPDAVAFVVGFAVGGRR